MKVKGSHSDSSVESTQGMSSAGLNGGTQQSTPNVNQQPRQGQPRQNAQQGSQRQAIPNPNQPVQRPVRGADGHMYTGNQQPNQGTQGGNSAPRQGMKTQSVRRTQPSQQGQRIQTEQFSQPVQNMQVNNPPKKKSKLPLIIGIVVALIGVLVAVKFIGGNKQTMAEVAYENTGRYALDLLQNALLDYDAETIDSLVSESYLAQEWDYANGNENRQMFINTVCANVKFEYPSVNALDTNGNAMTTSDGSSLTKTSDMLNGENFTVTVVDYEKLALTMEEDKELIQSMYKKSKYSPEDYTYTDEMIDLMIEYILSKGSLPTTTVEVSLPLIVESDTITNGEDTTFTVETYKIENDIALDKILFSSDAFHNMEDTFAKVATGWTGKKTETYIDKDWVENPEYTKWHDELVKRMEADGGKFNKNTSTWEPWFLRDENNNYVLDENGEKVVNYYTIKDENGNDIMQPDEKILGDVEKEREVDDPFIPEQVVTYVWCGAYYIQNEYQGNSYSVMQVGDGSFKRPAGVGTEIVTVVKGHDGFYHDIKISLQGYWVGQDAIDYAISFSEKNRGFDNSSVVQLICYELKIENLEKEDITIDSEMFLSDETSNQSARTGTMYGFYSEDVVIPAGKAVVINDWATSTELTQKYVCWGKTFGRNFDTVWFKLLAGNGGVVEQYDATKSTINKANVDENSVTQ